MRTSSTARIFSIPFNGDLRLVEEALLSGQVGEVYFGAPEPVNASRTGLPRARQSLIGQLRRLVALCRRHGALSNLLCNSYTLYHNDFTELFSFVAAVKDIDAITISDPLAIKEFKRRFPKKEIQASTIMNLNSADKISYAVGLGLSGVCMPLNCNRDGAVLDRVRGLKRRHPGLTVKLMVNQDCRANCVFAPWHYLLLAQSPLNLAPRPSSKEHARAYHCPENNDCRAPCDTPEDVVQVPFIRPEDISFYRERGWANLFKIVYRDYGSDLLRKIYAAYFRGSYDGDLFELVGVTYAKRRKERLDNPSFPRDFAARVTGCDKDCLDCSYCRDVAARVMRAVPP